MMYNIEISYVDMLRKLHSDVNTDAIPPKKKQKILALIEELKDILWLYSY